MGYYLTRNNQSEKGHVISAINKLIMQKCESYNNHEMYKDAQESFTDMCTIGPWTDDPKQIKEFKKWYEVLEFLRRELSWSDFEKREFNVDSSIRAATEDDYFNANMRSYPALYNIATIYGFNPKDDLPFSNDGGCVSEEDAKSWAEALESALDDIPDQKAEPCPKKVEEINSKMKSAFDSPENLPQLREALKTNPHASVLETFSGKKGKEYVRGFIEFLKRGSYSTW